MRDTPQMPGNDRKLMARLDISKVSQADEVELGDIVYVKLKGRVKALRGPDQMIIEPFDSKGKTKERKEIYPGSIDLEIDDMKISSEEDFSGMEEDE